MVGETNKLGESHHNPVVGRVGDAVRSLDDNPVVGASVDNLPRELGESFADGTGGVGERLHFDAEAGTVGSESDKVAAVVLCASGDPFS